MLFSAPAFGQSAPASAGAVPNAFNPAISLILDGQYRNLVRDPATYRIGGFIPGGDEVGPGGRSFHLGESELTISANIDPYFSGVFIGSASPDNQFSVEEAFVLNSGFVPGASVKFGRFLSGFGYLNEVHAHAWDFSDAPLIHQAFFGGQIKEEGVQLRWIAPTAVLLEWVAELGAVKTFPVPSATRTARARRRCRCTLATIWVTVTAIAAACLIVTRARQTANTRIPIPLARRSPTRLPGHRKCSPRIWCGNGRRTAM